MQQEEYLDLFIKYLDGEISGEELKMLRDVIKSDPELLKTFDDYRDIWDVSNLAYSDNKVPESSLKTFRKNIYGRSSIDIKPRGKLVRFFLQSAAVILLSIGIAFIYQNIRTDRGQAESSTGKFVSTFIPAGQKGQVTLADGTHIWLNSNTTLKYTTDFGDGHRNITLDGEAYFDVAKNPDLPFVVETSTISIKVLGTRFNLKTYNQDATVETTLEEGSLQILSATGNEKARDIVTLSPKEKATYHKDQKRLHVSKLDNKIKENHSVISAETHKDNTITEVETIVAWKDNNLIFKNQSLEEMSLILERWYGLEIEILSESIKDYHYSGKFIHNETIEQVMEVLSKTTPITYTLKNNTLTIQLISDIN